MDTIKYKGFLGSVEVSMKDNCIHGKILFVNDLITYEADSLGEIQKEFQAAVDDYIETCVEIGIEPLKSFNGSFNVRVGSDLHQKVALHALQNDLKLNTVVKKAIESYIDQPNAVPEVHNHNIYNVSVEKPYTDFIPKDIGKTKAPGLFQFNSARKIN